MRTREVSREGQWLAALPVSVSAWLVPGLGHLMLGKRGRALAFFGVVMALFFYGLHLKGQLFEVQNVDVLTLLAGIAEMGVGLPYFVADLMGLGRGEVTAVTYEYGYTLLIVAGLMNALIVLDAYDIAVGRKE